MAAAAQEEAPLLSDCIPAEVWAEAVLTMVPTTSLLQLAVAFGPAEPRAALAAATALRAKSDAARAAADAAADAADKAELAAENLVAATPLMDLAATLPFGASFVATRTLGDNELLCFARYGIPVTLQTTCETVHAHSSTARSEMFYLKQLPARVWRLNGKRHRDGGLPAVEFANGDREWWVNGELHRDGDLPAVERSNGVRHWYVHGVIIKRQNM